MRYEDVVLADGPVTFHAFGETSGTGFPNLGSAGGTAGPTGALVGVGVTPRGTRSVFYDGSNDFMSLNTDVGNVPSVWTVEAWCRPLSLAPADVNGVWAISAPGGWRRYMRINAGLLECGYTDTGATERKTTGVTLFAGCTYHIVYTHDGSAQVIYLNGRPVGSSSLTATPTTDMTGSQEHTVGGRWAGSSTTWPFHGFIWDVAVYGKVLGHNRIMAHYRAGLARPVRQAFRTRAA